MEEESDHLKPPILEDHTREEFKYLKSFISGGIAGVCAKTVIAPLDRIKIMFQATTMKYSARNAFNEGKKIIRTQGVTALWRGNTMTLLRAFPYAAIQFSAFDYFKEVLDKRKSSFMKKFNNFLAGSISGCLATLFTYPFEFVRTRMAVDRGAILTKSPVAIAFFIWKSDGIFGFYQGILPTLAGIIPYKGTGFFMFRFFKDYLHDNAPHLAKNRIFDFLFGALGGVAAQIITYPLDVIRKKLQSQRFLFQKGEIDKIRSIKELTLHTYRIEGLVGGFWKGFSMNLVKGPVATGTALAVKNIVNNAIDADYKD